MAESNQSESSLNVDTSSITSPIPNFESFNFSFNEDIQSNQVSASDLRDEQAVIDKTIKFLLNYSCTKKKAGRPRAGETSKHLQVPDTVNEFFKTLNNINELHGGVLLDYLIKINKFNKKLLNNFEILNNKYEDLVTLVKRKEPYDNVNKTDLHLSSESSELPNELPTSAKVDPSSVNTNVSLEQQKNNDDLRIKIDIIEQKSYSDTVICSGNIVDGILADVNSNDVGLKDCTISKIRSLYPNIENIEIHKVVIFGRDKKLLRITCTDKLNKDRLLNEARRVKLNRSEIFFNEYLTSYRNKLFYKLRNLRKTYPNSISTAYTRDGNIYYKLSSSVNSIILLRDSQLNDLELKLRNE